ncbi:MAG: hypothetical protein ACTHM2_18945 [Afipia sp.]
MRTASEVCHVDSPASPLGALSSLLSAKPLSSGLQSADAKSAEQKFLDTVGETPAQRMFNAMLGQLGLTEEEYQAMDPAEQQKVAQKIQELIQQQMEKGGEKTPGLVLDKTA